MSRSKPWMLVIVLLYPCSDLLLRWNRNSNILSNAAFSSWSSVPVSSTSSVQYKVSVAAASNNMNVYNSNNNKRSSRHGAVLVDRSSKESSSHVVKHKLSFLSNILYRHANPLLQNTKKLLESGGDITVEEGQARQIGMPRRNVEELVHKFDKELKETSSRERELSTWSFFQALISCQKRQVVQTAMLRLLNTCIQSLPSIFIARFLRCFEDSAGIHIPSALKNLAALLLVISTKMLTENTYFYYTIINALEVRGIISGLIFNKSLTVPSGASAATPASTTQSPNSNSKIKKIENMRTAGGTGSTLNLLQIDTSVIENFFLQIHTFWDGPLQILIYTSLLYHYLGSSVLYGIIVLLLSIPLNSWSLRVSNYLLQYENYEKDTRSKLTLESITNMKLLKFQAWEHSFQEKIETTRKMELQRLRRRGLVRALTSATTNAIPTIVLVVTFYHYTKLHANNIKPSVIFTAISLFNQLRFPLLFYPMLIDSLANAKNSFRRIVNYVNQDTMVPYTISHDGPLQIKHGNFLWSYPQKHDRDVAAALVNIDDLTVQPGQIIAVIGDVGSGKTAFIKALLGELVPVPPIILNEWMKQHHIVQNNNTSSLEHRHSNPSDETTTLSHIPTVLLPNNTTISYCAQEAWLSKGTLQNAILFGKPYHKQKYDEAIYDAGLDEDIINTQKLNHDTNVGESGSLLSGGQRARVALARALYNTPSYNHEHDHNSITTTPIYLLDDVLSSLDVNVSRTVFSRLLSRFSRENATVVFVTNDIPLVATASDQIILMGKITPSTSSSLHNPHNASRNSCSTIKDMGTYQQLLNRGHDLYNITHHEQEQENLDNDNDNDNNSLNENGTRQSIGKNYTENIVRTTSSSDTTTAIPHKKVNNMSLNTINIKSIPENIKILSQPPQPIPKASYSISTTTAAVPKSTYSFYLQSINNKFYFIAMIASFFMVNGSQFLQQLLISKWTNTFSSTISATTTKTLSLTNRLAASTLFFPSLIACSISISVFLFLRSFFTLKVGLQASRYFHSNLLRTVFQAPISFFDSGIATTTKSASSSGQIMNRFTKEMDVLDHSLPDGINSVLYCLFQIGFSIVTLSGIITPFMIIPLCMLGILYVRIMTLFRPTSRMYKRFESSSRAPVYTNFLETLKGIETIRSFSGSSLYYKDVQNDLVQENLNNYHTIKVLDRWLSIRLESLGNVVVGLSAITSIFLKSVGRIQPGSAAFGLTQSLSITGLLTWAVRCITEFETQMMSVQRIMDMSNIPSIESSAASAADSSNYNITEKVIPKEYSKVGEALYHAYYDHKNTQNYDIKYTPKTDLALRSTNWPWDGKIKLKNVSMKYDTESSQYILRNISLTVPAGSTLGIVGRTGSGKSSLLLTLFRLVEIESGGKISIDDVDIRSVHLRTLRSSLAIIPQNPVLFAGSLLHNLDATGSNSITEIEAWEALKDASQDLYTQLRRTGLSLDAIQITEGGKNYSQGQRQLICLARALLSNCKILVLDEATSSVDRRTDIHIQETIKREFVIKKGVTVITVAHRLETILEYDAIAVLGEGGRLVEYGVPNDLINNREGYLSQLVAQDETLRKNINKKKDNDSVLMSSELPSFVEQSVKDTISTTSNATSMHEDHPIALSRL